MNTPNAYTLKYQRKTIPEEIIFARKGGDQRYSIEGKEGTVSAYALRKDYKFIEDLAPKNSFKLKRNIKMKPILVLASLLLIQGCNSKAAPDPVNQSPAPIEKVKPIPETVILPGGSETTVLETKETKEESIKVEVLPEQTVSRSDFSVKSTLPWIAEVAKKANCVIQNKDFIKEVAAHPKFDFTTESSELIASKMVAFSPVIISTYCKKPRFGVQTNAYRNVGSNVIYFNTCIKRRSIESNVNTAVHERLHVVGYGHGDNKWQGKENSPNYKIGTFSEKYVVGCP